MTESDFKLIREVGRVEVDSARMLVVRLVEIGGRPFYDVRLWERSRGELRPTGAGLTLSVGAESGDGHPSPKSDQGWDGQAAARVAKANFLDSVISEAAAVVVPEAVTALGMPDLTALARICGALGRRGEGSFDLSGRTAAKFLSQVLGAFVADSRAWALLRKLAGAKIGFLSLEALGGHGTSAATRWRITGPPVAEAGGGSESAGQAAPATPRPQMPTSHTRERPPMPG